MELKVNITIKSAQYNNALTLVLSQLTLLYAYTPAKSDIKWFL